MSIKIPTGLDGLTGIFWQKSGQYLWDKVLKVLVQGELYHETRLEVRGSLVVCKYFLWTQCLLHYRPSKASITEG